jgi:O-methyltransferase
MATTRVPFYARGLQLPSRFRPVLSATLEKTLGRVDFERPASGLASIAYWLRFSRWCWMHPISDSFGHSEDKGRAWLHDFVAAEEHLSHSPILYLEFGVYRGASIRSWLERIPHPDSLFVGFDTFTGLPEHWRPTEPLGAFDAGGKLPDITDPRCSFEVGLFQDTLPAFIQHHDLSRRLVINLDADLFTSTLFVLTTLAPKLKPGDILFFDEFSCPLDEFRAFEVFTKTFRVQYEVLGAARGHTYVAMKIL